MAIPIKQDRQKLSLDDLRRTLEFKFLSPQMGKFVESYVQNYLDTDRFDPTQAAQAAYNCTTPNSARQVGYRLLANPKIMVVLDRFFGFKPEEVYRRVVENAAIYGRKLSIAQMNTLRIYAKMNGVNADTEDESEPASRMEAPQAPPPASAPSSIPIFPPAEPASKVEAPQPPTVPAAPVRRHVGDIVINRATGEKRQVTEVDADGRMLNHVPYSEPAAPIAPVPAVPVATVVPTAVPIQDVSRIPATAVPSPKRYKVGDIFTAYDEHGALHGGRVTKVEDQGRLVDAVPSALDQDVFNNHSVTADDPKVYGHPVGEIFRWIDGRNYLVQRLAPAGSIDKADIVP